MDPKDRRARGLAVYQAMGWGENAAASLAKGASRHFGAGPVRQTVVDAFANNFVEISTDRWRNIFAHDIPAKRQRQSSLFFPPLSKIDNFLEP